MAQPYYHEHPDALVVATEVADVRPGRVALVQSPFYPGGGGQLPDRGVIHWTGGEVAIAGFETVGGKLWYQLADPSIEVSGRVEAVVDPAFRQMMRELHTGTHILNAFVFQAFSGALVTGVYRDGTRLTVPHL